MKSIHTCLTPEIMQKLSHDELTVAELQQLEAHLDECQQCRRRLDEESADELWQQLIAPALRSSAEEHCDSAIDHGYGAEQSLKATLRLLGPTDDPRMLGRVGTYEIVGVIGRGGMGVVLKAFDAALNRYVAIKMLSPHLAESAAARKRFAREGQAAAAVINDYVMPIYGVAEWQNVPYLVMQYSRGSTLQKRVEDQGPLELKEILRIGMQTARGLAAAHAQGLVHRDVKPSNILIDKTVERALLTDFGLARAVDDASITRTGVIAGTPQYMSPEQARGGTVDARSDLFSLGSVLYFMGTGRPPFRADNAYAVLRLIIDQEAGSMQEVNPDLPAWLCTLISHLMAKDPGDRPATAQEVAETLQRCLAHLQQPTAVPLPSSIQAPATATAVPARQPVPRRAKTISLIIGTAVVAGLAGSFAFLGRQRQDGELNRNRSASIIGAKAGDQMPDISGLWDRQSGYVEQFSIERATDSPLTFVVSPPQGAIHKQRWPVQWNAERQQFEGSADVGSDITGALRLIIVTESDGEQLNVAFEFNELQKRQFIRSQMEPEGGMPAGQPPPTADELETALHDLCHQKWLRHDSKRLTRQTSQQAMPVASVESQMSDKVIGDESPFRSFDSNTVAAGAALTWRKYVEWWNVTQGTPLKPTAEIPRLAWSTPLVRLNPKYIYTHGVNIVIVRSDEDDSEDGIYIALAISSAPGPNDERFTRTFIANASGGNVFTFRRKGRFERVAQPDANE